MQIEATRRVRTDKRFGELVERLDKDARAAPGSRASTASVRRLREDIPIEHDRSPFLSFVANGLAFARDDRRQRSPTSTC